MGVLRRTFEDGSQRRFWKKAYELAADGSAFRMVGTVWNLNQTLWKKQAEERESKKKGGDETREV